MRSAPVWVAAVAGCLLPVAAFAQRGDAATENRINQLQRTLSDLSQQLGQLRQREQQLQQQMETMRTDYEARLERLEKGGAARSPTPRKPPPKPK